MMSPASGARRLASFASLVVLGALLRSVWLTADPPVQHPVGVVWHDEAAWAHNARNRALWGEWRTDQWNPVFVTPVFTGLEYAAFRVFGVGTWQARTVPVASGLAALVLLMAGLGAIGGRAAAVIGGALLATDFTWVMWNRAALMESTMTAFIVAAWAACALGERRPRWGFAAGVATVLAWFTKASAVFFAAALVADALWTIGADRLPRLRDRLGLAQPPAAHVRAAWMAIGGLAAAAGVIGVTFVMPYWTEYQFYNWQMSVLRKPSYDVRSLIDRATWLPVVQDFFTRMWPILVGAALAIAGIAARWREASPARRLLVLWMLLGLLELTIHDSGNERRYVMFLPALIALAALVAAPTDTWLPARLTTAPVSTRLLAAPLVLLLGYLVFGSLLRALFQDAVHAGDFRMTVRLSAVLAATTLVILLVFWQRIIARLGARRIPARAAVAIVVLSIGWNVAQFARWAANRGELNYQASVAVGRLLPPGTLVHGKLANGLSLENRIRPVFVGRGFGNYEDRLSRDDARYILTYGLPRTGYESQPGLIQEILDRYPHRRVVATFEVDETPALDQAWLIDKTPGAPPGAASGSNRAPD